MRNNGFSLIELVVVITIIGVIVAMVIPNFQSYIIRGRVSTAFDVMKFYAQVGEEYYEAHGAFGNAEEIGLDIGSQSNEVANPQTINKYTTVQIVDVDNTSLCYNNIRFTFSGSALGASQDFDIQMVVRPNNGMYQVTCGIPWDQTATTYANVLKYFPESCVDQNVSTC